MASILAELRSWASTLPYWEQAALDKIVAGVQFTDSEYNELLQYLLEDARLAEPVGKRPKLKFPTHKDEDFQSPTKCIKLAEISNLQDVNALVSGQRLTFGPALTVIYGVNASGKSGYARVLGCAGFTRGDKKVLPDATQSFCADKIPSADIKISGETFINTINYQADSGCLELASFYVFDSTSVYVHLTGSNKFSFTPAGLSYLTKLVDITDKVRKRLKDRIEEYVKPYDFNTFFYGESEVRELISNLDPETDLDELKRVATFTKNEEKQIKKLDTEIAKLKVKNIPEQLDNLEKTIEDLEGLVSSLRELENKSNEEFIDNIGGIIEEYHERKSQVKISSIDQFKSEYFTQVGTKEWQEFVEAAKILAGTEEKHGKSYPQPEDRCLLCQQPLSSEARKFLLKLWEFLKGEAQSKLEDAQKMLEEMQQTLNGIDHDFFDEQSVCYRYLQKHDSKLLERVVKFIESCRRRRDFVLKNLYDLTEKTVPPILDSEISYIKKIIGKLKDEYEKLEKENPTEKIVELEEKRINLEHRKLLKQYLPEIEKYIQRLIWAQKASEISSSSRHITLKYNQLFRELVTDRYIELFEEILKILQRPLKVNIKTVGRKGNPYKQIVLETDPSIPTDIFEIGKILSEGEKRAVALADFLTEVALDSSSNGIMLDDPVTSLDLEWMRTIAHILAKEAKNRQVIVFTHDMSFLYFLKKYANQEQVEILTHWIKRGDIDDKPGYIFLNNSPALTRERRRATKAREFYNKAKSAPPEEQEYLLRQGFGDLRTSYEAFIIFDLFNDVVMRFDPRISFGRLKDIVWDESIVKEVIEKCELLSGYIEGHLPPDTAERPTCKTLIEEIDAFDMLRKRLKDLKKS